MKFTKEKGITLIALVITIIVLIILAGISISLVLGENGLFNKAKSAATETAKARFLEDAGFAYSEAYIEKVEESNANDITIGTVVEKLKSSYGYTNEQIVMVSSGMTDIMLSETDIKIEAGETKEVTVTLGNGTYCVLIEGLYYPITLSNDGITLGEGIEKLPQGEEATNTITATATVGGDFVDVTIVEETTIKITAKEGQAGKATITVTYGGIKKEITVTIIWEVKQGDEVPLGPVSVTVNGEQKTLAQGWKYFYDDKEKNKAWLIYSGTMEGVALQKTNGTIQGSGVDGRTIVYSSNSRQDLLDYLNGKGNYTTVWNHIKTGIKNALSAKGVNVIESQIEVKGSPNIELFQKAYDQMYPNEKFQVNGSDNVGWQYKFGDIGSFVDSVSVNNYNSKPLFIISNNIYWLASPSNKGDSYVCRVHKSNGLDCGVYNHNGGSAARPVVSIPKAAFDQLVGN